MDGGAFHGGTWPAEQPQLYAADMKYASLPSTVMHTSNGSASDLGPKVECVYSLLSMLGSHDSLEMSAKFLELSKNRETCAALRRSGCIPLLVQIMHSDPDLAARKKAGQALHNVVHCHPDDKAGRREARVLRLIEQLIEYCDSLREKLTRRDGVENGGYILVIFGLTFAV
jgi:adenomatosis polyposis coli protein